jgi:hypothetical protein
MPDPLSADFAATLRSDPVAALAAAFIIETHHPNVLHWVVRAVQPVAPERRPRKRKANGVHKLADAYLARRRRKRDRDDKALVEQNAHQSRGFDWRLGGGRPQIEDFDCVHAPSLARRWDG